MNIEVYTIHTMQWSTKKKMGRDTAAQLESAWDKLDKEYIPVMDKLQQDLITATGDTKRDLLMAIGDLKEKWYTDAETILDKFRMIADEKGDFYFVE